MADWKLVLNFYYAFLHCRGWMAKSTVFPQLTCGCSSEYSLLLSIMEAEVRKELYPWGFSCFLLASVFVGSYVGCVCIIFSATGQEKFHWC